MSLNDRKGEKRKSQGLQGGVQRKPSGLERSVAQHHCPCNDRDHLHMKVVEYHNVLVCTVVRESPLCWPLT